MFIPCFHHCVGGCAPPVWCLSNDRCYAQQEQTQKTEVLSLFPPFPPVEITPVVYETLH